MNLRPLSRRLLSLDALAVAPLLLNKVLVAGERRLRIVEVEAYRGADDPASHAFRGPTPRNAPMYEVGGILYVYFVYGMHWCANVVCGPPGQASAVLLRAAEPLAGLEAMRRARGAKVGDRDLANGPGKLGQALELGRSHNKVDLTKRTSALWLGDDGISPPDEVATGPRIGLRVGTELQWRYWIPASPFVSRMAARPG